MPAIETHYCSACGQELAIDTHFCPACGAACQVRRAIPGGSQTAVPNTRIGVAVALAGSGLLGLMAIILIVMASRPNSESISPAQTQAVAGAGVSVMPTLPPAPNQEQTAGVVIPSTKKTAPPAGLLPTPSNTGKNPSSTDRKPDPNGHQIVKSKRFGFAFELPKHWEHNLKGDTLFLSPSDDSPESKEIWGDVQVISKRPGGTLKEQVGDLKKQLKGFKNLVVGLEESTDFSGQPATYLLIRYFQEAVEAEYVGIWIIAERGPYYYWLSFQILQEHFDEHSPVVVHVLETFQFSPIDQPK